MDFVTKALNDKVIKAAMKNIDMDKLVAKATPILEKNMLDMLEIAMDEASFDYDFMDKTMRDFQDKVLLPKMRDVLQIPKPKKRKTGGKK